MKNKTTENKQNIAPYTTEFMLTKDQYDRLFGSPLKLETLEGATGWIGANGDWRAAGKCKDGSWGISFGLSLVHDSRHGPLIDWMMRILSKEAYMGQHSQDSLDDALLLCEKLIPDKAGWVSGSALHEFMGERTKFPLWCFGIQFMVEHSPVSLYRIKKMRHVLGQPLTLKLSAPLASQIALSADTPRGVVLRQEFFTLETALLFPPMFEHRKKNACM